MRIVGGKYRGRNLVAFDGDKIRPTSDKVRESVFNILQFGLSGADFLDLFSAHTSKENPKNLNLWKTI